MDATKVFYKYFEVVCTRSSEQTSNQWSRTRQISPPMHHKIGINNDSVIIGQI